ncbi:hypothetical protein Q3G72_034186 [Acer saccharum]|nr:hypothetical protein Q3G72_034186 [Acer saccharum]
MCVLSFFFFLGWNRVGTLHEEKRLEVLVDRDLKGCFDASDLEKALEGIAVQAPSHTEPVPFTSLRRSRYFHHFSNELLIYMTRYPCLSLVLGYPTFHRHKSSHVESFMKNMDVVAEFDDLIYTE